MVDNENTYDEEATRLERAWIIQLSETWGAINYNYFRHQMKRPTIALSNSETRLGLWHPEHRTIEISRKLCLEQPWGVVVEVLKHEAAHQYVHEVLKVFDETAHGPAFRQTCERVGIDMRAAGMPQPSAVSEEDNERAKLLQRVSKLLALAESQNQHEAEAAMSAAQKLMLKHNIDSLAAQQAQRGYGFRHLGKVKARVFEPERRIGSLLGDHFFVEAIWVPSYDFASNKSGRVLEVIGSEENLAMAEYVHGFLMHTSERLWREYKKKQLIKQDKERLAFLAGVIQGFEETLATKAKQHKEEGLVWVGDAKLSEFYRTRHPRVRHTYHAGAFGSARNDGRSAGRQLVLSKPLQSHGNGGASPRLLSGHRS